MTAPERDFVGYGANPPDPRWPGGARVAVQFVLNYEEGSERSILDGDDRTETEGWEASGIAAAGVLMAPGRRDLIAESHFQYGSRVGFWRLMRIFAEYGVPITVGACALALERNPEAARAIVAAGHEICCHGWRWMGHHELSEEREREVIARAVASIQATAGMRPLGWYTRYAPSLNTRRLLVEESGFLYDSDAYDDELPYWVKVGGRPHLVIPYAFDTNDMQFKLTAGFATADQFYSYLRDTFEFLYAEGAKSPRIMSVGLHTRLCGRPGRATGLARFLEYLKRHDHVWVCRRIDIAHHWRQLHPYAG
jgi:putative urate catabolism protein